MRIRLPWGELLAVLLISAGCGRTSPSPGSNSPPEPRPAEAVPTGTTAAPPTAGAPQEQGERSARVGSIQELSPITVKMPAEISDLCVCAGGRFVVMSFESLGKLALFDVSAGKIVGYVPLESRAALFAAGAEKLIVVDPQKRIIQRYALNGLKLEDSQPLTLADSRATVDRIVMGASSRGPLFFAASRGRSKKLGTIDVATLKYMECPVNRMEQGFSGRVEMRASADGRTLGCWQPNSAPTGLFVMRYTGNALEGVYHHANPMHVCLDDHGEHFYSDLGIDCAPFQANRMDPSLTARISYLPAIGAPLYMTYPFELLSRVRRADRAKLPRRPGAPWRGSPEAEAANAAKLTVSIHRQGELSAFAKIELVGVPNTVEETFSYFDQLTIDKRLVLLAAARKLLTIPEPRDALVLRPLDLATELATLGNDSHELTTEDRQPPVSVGGETVPLREKHLPAISPSKAVEDVVVKLPAACNDICAGGSGRFLVLGLKSMQKLAVFDVMAARIAGYIPMRDSAFLFAAGAEKVVVVYPGKQVIQRYDLATRRLETTRRLSLPWKAAAQRPRAVARREQAPLLPPSALVMGAGSHGPLLITGREIGYDINLALLDLDTLQRLDIPLTGQAGAGVVESAGGDGLRASGDGRVFGAWMSNWRPDGVRTVVLSGQRAPSFFGNGAAGWIAPDETGERVYSADGIFSETLQPIEPPQFEKAVTSATIPAVSGPFYVRAGYAARETVPAKPTTITVHVAGVRQPLATLTDLPIRLSTYTMELINWRYNGKMSLDRRIYLVPFAKALAVVSETSDSIVLRRFDPEEELRRSGRDYLVLLSCQPPSAAVGRTLEYQIDARSNRGKISYKLDSGPEGMTVSETGLLRWQIKDRPPEGRANVAITVSDGADQKVSREFRVHVKQADDPTAAPAASAADATVEKTVPTPAAADEAPPKPAAQDVRCPLPGRFDAVRAGAGGRLLIFHCKSLEKLVVFDLRSGRITGELPEKGELLFAAGATKLLVVHPEKLVVERYRLDTLALETTRVLPFGGLVAAAAMGSASSGPLLLLHGDTTTKNMAFFDVDSLEPLALTVRNGNRVQGMVEQALELRASTDGRVFTGWRSHGNPSGIFIWTIQGNEVLYRYEHRSSGCVTPDEHGERIYAGGTLLTKRSEGADEAMDPRRRCLLVPAATGPLYLRIPLRPSAADRNTAAEPVTVHLESDSDPLLILPGAAALLASKPHVRGMAEQVAEYRGLPFEKWLDLDQRAYLVPEAEVLAMLPEERDCVVLRRFRLSEELARTEKDFIAIVSRPPQSVIAGQTLDYQVKAFSHNGDFRFNLESGPPEMTLSPDGMLRWTVTEQTAAREIRVVITASDRAGHTALHSFALEVIPSVRPAAVAPVEPKISFSSPPTSKARFVVTVERAAPVTAPQAEARPQPQNSPHPAVAPRSRPTAEMICQLPGVCGEACVGAGGRFLVFRIKSPQELAVLDVISAKVVGELPTGTDDVLFAAGREKLVLINPEKRTLERYRLDNLQRETTSRLSVAEPVCAAAIGSASAGPVCLLIRNDFGARPLFLDLNTLKPLRTRVDTPLPTLNPRPFLRASADGRVFAWTHEFGFYIARLSGDRLVSLSRNEERGGRPCPDEFGDRIYAMGSIYSDRCGLLGSAEAVSNPQLIPAVQGPLYLCVPGVANPLDTRRAGPLTVQLDGRPGPLIALPEVTPHLARSDRPNSQFHPADERVFFIPSAKVLAVVPEARSTVVLHYFDLNDELKARGTDELVVLSRPPRRVRIGETLNYQIDAWSKAGSVTWRLETGPRGMTVSDNGLLSWSANERVEGGMAHVVLIAKDASGQTARHDFDLEMDDGERGLNKARAAAEFRTFRDVTGKFEVEATFVGLVQGNVQIKKKDGKTILVPLEKLCPSDRQWVEQQ
jgi:hypothetical protein